MLLYIWIYFNFYVSGKYIRGNIYRGIYVVVDVNIKYCGMVSFYMFKNCYLNELKIFEKKLID